MRPVQQDWVCALSLMQQSVLLAAVRAPDGIRKDHPVKIVMRWYRRCILFSAFEGGAILDPYSPGGGSFTGPFEPHHAAAMGIKFSIDEVRGVYLRHVDELPHHFHLHLMHGAEIVGYKHPDVSVGAWWSSFYRMIVNDAHLFPESVEQMDARLGDTEAGWRAREEVPAK